MQSSRATVAKACVFATGTGPKEQAGLPPVTVDEPLGYSPDVSLARHAAELHVSYYDAANGALKYAHRTTSGAWSSEFVDTSGDVGLYSSIAVDQDGNPHIAYYDVANGDLRYATFSAGCEADGDCDDQNDCTADACNAQGKCTYTPTTGGCTLGGADGICCGGTCTLPVCEIDSDCFELDADTCVGQGACTNTCETSCGVIDGFCPTGCSEVNDADCPACDSYENRKSCNADSRCRWSNQSKYCDLR